MSEMNEHNGAVYSFAIVMIGLVIMAFLVTSCSKHETDVNLEIVKYVDNAEECKSACQATNSWSTAQCKQSCNALNQTEQGGKQNG